MEDDVKQAEFEFAPFDPIRIDFEESKIAISTNLKSFKVGKGKKWKRLNLKVHYEPQIEDGFKVRMIQTEAGLHVSGARLKPRDQIAIRVICEVLFPKEFSIKLMPDHLARQLRVNELQATQFVVANGWIGISVDDARQIAGQQQSPARQGRRLFDRRRQ